MKIKNSTANCCKKCLHQSLPVDIMIRFAKMTVPEYSIYKRSGLKDGMPIPNQNAADQIVNDMIQDEYFIDFVETLINVEKSGFMGHHYLLKGLNDVVDSLINEGYVFDKISGQFFENQNEHISLNWGRLKEGDEKKMTVLRLDIAGNSELVKNNPMSKIQKTYNDIRDIVYRAVTSRNGRLWTWEGDGALAAFLFGPIEKMVVFAGIEIIHELFFYNKLHNQLASPVKLRLSAHIGSVNFSNNEMERLKNETIKEAMALESIAAVNSMNLSYNLYINMDQFILSLFSPEKTKSGRKYRYYKMDTEK